MAAVPYWYYTFAKSVIDLSLLAGAFGLAFEARFEGAIPPHMATIFWYSLPLVLAVQYMALSVFSVPRLAWRAVSGTEIRCIVGGLVVGTSCLVLVRLSAVLTKPTAEIFLIPFSVLLIDFTLCVLGFLGLRGLWRTWVSQWHKSRSGLHQVRPVRTLLVGTDHKIIQTACELTSRPQTAIQLLGILADFPGQMNMIMGGLPVLGTVAAMKEVVQLHDVEQILIPRYDDGVVVRQLLQQCDQCGVKARSLDVGALGDGQAPLAHLRSITVEDLLRRPPVHLAGDAVADMIQGRTVFVTGAGGSIGSQLCREICRFRPLGLVLVERAENSLFNVHRLLAQEFPRLSLVPAIADVCDAARMEQLFRNHQPDVVFHAAAHKHVPMMEWNVREAIRNNVAGTQGLANLSHQFGVQRFVMVSTDKAVRPSSVMGVSKRVAELYVQALAQQSKTCFVTVRFGNVLGSAGSVIPIFQEQIANGGPVTVTHADMMRYFMTIPEACQLVLEAGSLGQGGEIFILDMGKPVRIVDLAQDIIRLAGLRPQTDIEIRFTGVRPGEKLFEELSLEEENAERTRHPRIYIGRKPAKDLPVIAQQIAELVELAECGEPERMRKRFKDIVPDYNYLPAGQGETCPPPHTRADLPTKPTLNQVGTASRESVHSTT